MNTINRVTAKCIILGINNHLDDICGLRTGCVRAIHEPLLVLEPGEAIPAVWRLQNRREHTSPGKQPGYGVDGHVFLARTAHYQRGQVDGNDVRAVMGCTHVQRAARRRFPGQSKQQFLPGPVAHHAVPVRAARRLRHRLDRTIVALWPVLPVQEDLSHIYQLDQKGCAKPDGAPGA